MENETEFLTTSELSKLLNISKRFIIKWRGTGRIPGVLRLGNRYRFKRSAIEKAILQGEFLHVE